MEERQPSPDDAVPNPAWSTAAIPTQPAVPGPAPFPPPGPAPFHGPAAVPGPVAAGSIDRMPRSDRDRALFAAMSASARSAAYLNSIRKMMIFFVVLAITGIVLSIIFFILVIHSADQVTTTPDYFGN
ncbi:MAG TPA: hypothetical protein VGX23_37045 [Actinocrinis sp.]|nr:hypothetical protein [Actinocrinis sp.]